MGETVRVSSKGETKTSMMRFLKKIDSEGGVSSLLNAEDEFGKYVKFCYSLNKPRKLSTAIKIAIENEEHHGIVISLIEQALVERRLKVIQLIEKKASEDTTLAKEIDLSILKFEIARRFGRNISSSAEMLTRILNDPELLAKESGKSTYQDLFMRLKKMFRQREWEAISSLLENVVIMDSNFQCSKFYLLSISKLGKKELFEELVNGCCASISDVNNIEDLVDILYTEDMNNRVIDICGSRGEDLTFRTYLIYARSLRKVGLVSESDRILEKSKLRIHEMIREGEVDISSITNSIMDIGYSGDIQASEKLLFELTSRGDLSSEIIEEGMVNKFVDLVNDTLDRQKRLRLSDALSTSRRLIQSKEYEISFRLLKPFVEHGIENSSDLFEQFAISALGCGNRESIEDLIQSMGNRVNSSTAERFLESLDSRGEYRLHSMMIRGLRFELLDSRKIIRSYFKVRLHYSGGMGVKEYLRRLISLKGGGENIERFVEMACFQGVPNNEIVPILLTSRINEVEKNSCMLEVYRASGDFQGIRESIRKILGLTINENPDSNVVRLFEKAANLSLNMGDFEETILLVDMTGDLVQENRHLCSAKIRSLITLGRVSEAEELLEENGGLFSDIQNLRFNLELGNREKVKERVAKLDFADTPVEEQKKIAEIFFRLNMHVEYTNIFHESVLNGEFNLREITRYFHSLCKLGEDQKMIDEFHEIKRFHSWNPVKRAILAIVSYDFQISEDYVDEIDIAISMDPKGTEIPLLVCNAFYSLERVDIAYYFLSRNFHLMQNSEKTSEIARKIGSALKDLEISPHCINRESLVESPIFSDVEVIRKIVKLIGERGGKGVRKVQRKKRIAIQSHTLDIGGAERQVSLILRLLSEGKIKSESFALVTNLIPRLADYSDTYYHEIEDRNIHIFEYSKPAGYYGKTDTREDLIAILQHISPLKRNRIMSLESIYSKGEFDVAHTWQDWCNIYGGIAALMAGVDEIIMAGRTLPPIMKSRLQARSGRSYREAYRILLSTEGVSMVHNSNSGRNEYANWLGTNEDDFSVLYNGYNLKVNSRRDSKRGREIRSDLGIPKNCTVVGYVGRFSSDKRPWIFLAMAESILSRELGAEHSVELQKWVIQNEGDVEEEIEVFPDSERSGELVGIDEIQFIMVGEGPQLEKARAIVEDSEILRERVHIVGYSPEVSSYMMSFDCFVLTSKVEGLPNVIIEAKFSGLPVLTTDAGGASECIDEGETGQVAKSDSPSYLAETLLEMLNDKKFMKGAPKKAKKFASSEFSKEILAKRMGKLYGGNL